MKIQLLLMKAFIWIDRFKRRCGLDTNPGVGDNQTFCLPREVDIGKPGLRSLS
jgi:hypothetical protein